MRRLASLCALALLPLLWLGCESGIDQPPEAAPEARAATALLPPNAKVLVMADLQHMRQRGPEAMRDRFMIPDGDGASASSARLRDFLSASGIDPDRDVHRVYAALPDTDGAAPRVVAYGSFDRERVAQAVQTKFGDDLERATYRNVDLFAAAQPDTDGRRFALAVPNSEMAIATGDRAELEAMIDRLRDGGDAPDPGPLVRQASQGQSFWMVARDLPSGNASNAKIDEMRQLRRALKDMAAHLSFASDGSADGQFIFIPKDASQASDVADVLRGAIGAMKQEASKPDSDAPAEFREALSNVQVETSGSEVRATFRVPKSLVDEMTEYM